MKILVLNWRDFKHPLAGGAEFALLKHVQFWQKKGAVITWICSMYPDAKDKEVINEITYIRKGSQYTVHLSAFLYLIKSGMQEFDIIIDNFHFLPFFTPLYCKPTKIIAFIHEVAGKIWYKNLPKVPASIGYILEPWYFKLYKNVPFITVSNSTKSELIMMGIPKEKISIIPNGVSPVKKISTGKEKIPTILFLGRLSYDKGIKDALEAITILYKKNKKIQFWIVGKEEKSGMYEKIMKIYSQVAPITKYWGYVDERKKFELLKRSWILIHPSAKEGWGLTVIEAASQGTPTVGYNVEGLRDSIVSNRTGILTDKYPKSLARAIQSLLTSKRNYTAMCQKSITWSKKFDWGKSVKQSWDLVKKQYH